VIYAVLGFLLLGAALAGADEPNYRIERDPDVSCRMRPEEVATAVGGPVSFMLCTLKERLRDATVQEGTGRRATWYVRGGECSEMPLRGIGGKGYMRIPRGEYIYIIDDEKGVVVERSCGPPERNPKKS
jgi:hypothetical protein